MALVLKWCELENQYMAEEMPDAKAEADCKAGKSVYEPDGTYWYLKAEHESQYNTKVMEPKAKKAPARKAPSKAKKTEE